MRQTNQKQLQPSSFSLRPRGPRLTPKGKPAPALTVGEWYTRHSEALQLRLLGPAVGFDRVIREPTINRPGLALSGFFAYFAVKRIQVLGSAEHSYLKSLPREEIRAALARAFLTRTSPAWSSPAPPSPRPPCSKRPPRPVSPYSGRR